MPLSPKDIARLLVGHLSGELTEAEAWELKAWANRSRKHIAVTEELGDDEQIRALAEQRAADRQEDIQNRLLDKVRALIAADQAGDMQATPIETNPTPVHFLRRQWLRYAAAVIIIAGIGAYLWNTQQQKEKPSVTQTNPHPVKNDFAPGGNRAVLTLADGKTIVLDSADRGTIAEQGMTRVRKTSDGSVVYEGSREGKGTETVLMNTLTTPRGGQYQLTLPDGSQVWLNAASSITYPTAFTGSERKVQIAGEAYFEVSHDAAKPFIVESNNTSIRVLGTQFNVNAYADEPDMRTTLLEGSVKISKEDEQQTLKPGQQAIVKGSLIRVSRNVNTDEVVAWKNGQFEFASQRDIKSIMRQISRWYDVEIEYRGEPKGQIGGSIPRNVPASKIFSMFEATGAVHFQIEGKKVIVLP